MNRPKFISGFAEEINRYLDYKTASGYKESSFTFILRQFDRFCAGRGIRWKRRIIRCSPGFGSRRMG